MSARFPERIDALVFDCGDTLLHLQPSKIAICAEVLGELGRPIATERIQLAYRVADALLKQRSSLEDTQEKKRAFFTEFNTLLTDVLGIESLAATFDAALQAAFSAKRHWSLIEGAGPALELLAAQRPLVKESVVFLARLALAP